MFPTESYNNSGANGSDMAAKDDVVVAQTIALAMNFASSLLAVLFLLPYICLLRTAWKLPKGEMLPWILLNLFLVGVTALVRNNIRLTKQATELKLGKTGIMLSSVWYCRGVLVTSTMSFIANNFAPPVFVLIEIITQRRTSLASKQWLFNFVGLLALWLADLGLSLPFFVLNFIEPAPLTCREVGSDHVILVYFFRTSGYMLSVYAVFLLLWTLSSQLQWKRSLRLGIEAMVFSTGLYNLQIFVIALVVVAPRLSGVLTFIPFSILGLSDLFVNSNGIIIFLRYKEARHLAKEMLQCCCRRHRLRVQPSHKSSAGTPA